MTETSISYSLYSGQSYWVYIFDLMNLELIEVSICSGNGLVHQAPSHCLTQRWLTDLWCPIWNLQTTMTLYELTHWGRVTHICAGNLTIIGSDNGLSPGWRQAIIWTNVGLLLIGPLGTNFSEILIKILTFSFKKIHLKVSSAKRRPFCLGLNVLTMHWNNGLKPIQHQAINHLNQLIPPVYVMYINLVPYHNDTWWTTQWELLTYIHNFLLVPLWKFSNFPIEYYSE